MASVTRFFQLGWVFLAALSGDGLLIPELQT